MTMTAYPIRAVVLATSSGAAGWLLADQGASEAAMPRTLESLVTAGVLIGGAVAALAVAVLSFAALVEGLLGWRPRAAGALPAPLRRFLMGSVAAAIVVGAALPASADEVYPGWAPAVPLTSEGPTPVAASPSPVATVAPTAVAPTAVATAEPSRPGATVPPVELHAESAAGPVQGANATGAAESGHGGVGIHVVTRGDSLWRIAGELLGPDASNADIARAWPLIYQANRATIGSDPGLIMPGQHLTIPQELAA